MPFTAAGGFIIVKAEMNGEGDAGEGTGEDSIDRSIIDGIAADDQQGFYFVGGHIGRQLHDAFEMAGAIAGGVFDEGDGFAESADFFVDGVTEGMNDCGGGSAYGDDARSRGGFE